MGEIILVRHGQANSKATSEAEYDRLSDLGHEQAGWLGEWLREHEAPFDRVISGDMRRHRETAAGIGLGPAAEDPRLNEVDYFTLAHAMAAGHGLPLPGPGEWPAHMRRTFPAWAEGKVAGAESHGDFITRTAAALTEAAAPGARILCVTSGGVIGATVARLLGLGPAALAGMILPVGHTSLTRLRVDEGGAQLFSYNAYPHFERADRRDRRSWM